MQNFFHTEVSIPQPYNWARKSLYLIASRFFNTDSSLYAHYVFKAFDVNCNGAISFRDHIVTLSTLLRGSVYERLKWTFKLYDLNGDGCISKEELAEVVIAVHELMGRKIAEDDPQTRQQASTFYQSYLFKCLLISMISFEATLSINGNKINRSQQ